METTSSVQHNITQQNAIDGGSVGIIFIILGAFCIDRIVRMFQVQGQKRRHNPRVPSAEQVECERRAA